MIPNRGPSRALFGVLIIAMTVFSGCLGSDPEYTLTIYTHHRTDGHFPTEGKGIPSDAPAIKIPVSIRFESYTDGRDGSDTDGDAGCVQVTKHDPVPRWDCSQLEPGGPFDLPSLEEGKSIRYPTSGDGTLRIRHHGGLEVGISMWAKFNDEMEAQHGDAHDCDVPIIDGNDVQTIEGATLSHPGPYTTVFRVHQDGAVSLQWIVSCLGDLVS